MHALTGKAVATVIFLAVAIVIFTGTGTALQIDNGDFETGSMSPPYFYRELGSLSPSAAIVSDEKYQGSYSLCFPQYGGWSGYSQVPAVYWDDVTLTSGGNVSFWVKVNVTTHATTAYLRTYDNGAFTGGIVRYTPVPGTLWTKYTWTNTPAGTFRLSISFGTDGMHSPEVAKSYIDDFRINGEPYVGEPINYNDYEISIVDSMTSALVENAASGFYDYNTSTWTNYTATTGQHAANLTANHTYQWVVSKTGYEPYIEDFTANYANGYTVIKSCSLINIAEPLDPALTYVTFRVTANSRLTGALVALDDGQSKLTDGEGVAFFMVPKYEDYNFVVKYTGYYSYYGVFNLTESEYIDIHLTAIGGASPTPTPGPGQLPDYDLGSVEDLTALYKDLVNASIDKSLNRTYEAFNDTAGWYFMQLNDSASTWHQFFIDQYETPTGYGYVYYDLLDLIFSFIPAQVKAQLAYYFLWIFFLILLGK